MPYEATINDVRPGVPDLPAPTSARWRLRDVPAARAFTLLLIAGALFGAELTAVMLVDEFRDYRGGGNMPLDAQHADLHVAPIDAAATHLGEGDRYVLRFAPGVDARARARIRAYAAYRLFPAVPVASPRAGDAVITYAAR